MHGVAFGLSVDIIAACDVRYAAEDVRFSIKVRRVLLPDSIMTDVPCFDTAHSSLPFFCPLVYHGQEVDVGLAADIGTLARLPKLAGNQSLVHELAYTAREFGAEEAARMGLVSRVVRGGRDAVLAAALETAGVIARKSPIAVVGTKRVLQHARDHS